MSSARRCQSWSGERNSGARLSSTAEENLEAALSSAHVSIPISDQTREPATGSSSRIRSSSAPSNSDRPTVPSPSLAQAQMQQHFFEQHQRQHSIHLGERQPNFMIQPSLHVPSDTNGPQGMPSTFPIPNSTEHISSCNMSDIEHQKAVNARLQQQIEANIRRQEELARQLQGSKDQSTRLQHLDARLHHGMDNHNFASTMMSAMQPRAIQLNYPSNIGDVKGMQQGSVPSTQTPFNAFLNQQQPANNSNPSVMQPQHMFNLQQGSNLNLRMDFGNSTNMVAQSTGPQGQATNSTLMHQLAYHQRPTFLPPLMGGNNSVNLNSQQVASLQALHQHHQNTGPSPSVGECFRQDNTSHNNFHAQSGVAQSQQFGNMGNPSSGSDLGDDHERTPLDDKNEDSDDDSPLSPNSFRW